MGVKLYKKQAREGFDKYQDLLLCWSYRGKKYCVRVRPCFSHDIGKLLAMAETFQNK